VGFIPRRESLIALTQSARSVRAKFSMKLASRRDLRDLREAYSPTSYLGRAVASVRFGSQGDILGGLRDVRYSPQKRTSGLSSDMSALGQSRPSARPVL
jgi:hypothetical protein